MNDDRHLESMENHQLITVIRNLKNDIKRYKDPDKDASGNDQDYKDESSWLKELYAISFQSDESTQDIIDEILTYGTELLDLDIGILSKIVDQRYIIRNIYSKTAGMEKGTEFDLKKTCCNIPVNRKKTVAIEHMGESRHSGHPGYKAFEYESYIGIPVMVKEKLYGTLNFSSHYPRKKGFTQADKRLVQVLALWIVMEIENTSLKHDQKDTLAETEKKYQEQISNLKKDNLSNETKMKDRFHKTITLLKEEKRLLKNHAAELQKIEKHLRNQNDYNSSVIELSPECILSINSEGDILEFNPAAEKIFGYSKNEITGKNIMDTILPSELEKEDEKRLLSYLRTGSGNATHKKFEVHAQKKDGSLVKSKLIVSEQEFEKKQIFIIYIRDISEFSQTRNEIKKSVESLSSALDSLRKIQS